MVSSVVVVFVLLESVVVVVGIVEPTCDEGGIYCIRGGGLFTHVGARVGRF